MSDAIKMNMIEKVAKSLYPMFDADCECNRCLTAKNDAKVAIAVMREPSEEMILNGNKHLNFHPSEKAAMIGYQAMIDAALKE